MEKLMINTSSRSEMIDITTLVQETVQKLGCDNGICLVYVPHTTCGVTINEAFDRDVRLDMLDILEKLVPYSRDYRHGEGNSDAHMKASLLGSSVLIPINSGKLELGTWQGIFFGEFDGPRRRHIFVKTL